MDEPQGRYRVDENLLERAVMQFMHYCIIKLLSCLFDVSSMIKMNCLQPFTILTFMDVCIR